jgi:hypothetical protein
MYNKILNPMSGRMVLISSKLGKSILTNYLNQLGGSYKLKKNLDFKINMRLFFKVVEEGIKLYIPIHWSREKILSSHSELTIENKYAVLLITPENIYRYDSPNFSSPLFNILHNCPKIPGRGHTWKKNFSNIFNIIDKLLTHGEANDIYDPSKTIDPIKKIPKLKDIVENEKQRKAYIVS